MRDRSSHGVNRLQIRHMDVPADIPQIIAFLPELYETNFPGFVADAEFLSRKRLQLREVPRDPGQVVLVCEEGYKVVGFIWLVIEVEFSGRRRGEIAAVHVDRQHRGKGFGRELMAEGEAILRSYGCEQAHLMVTADNDRAVKLYRELGYDVTRFQMEKPLPKKGARP